MRKITESRVKSRKNSLVDILTVLVLTICVIFSFLSFAKAETLYVGSGEVCTTIQAGIDVASNGDTVIVRDGTYSGAGNKDLDFHGKTITLCSENGAGNTIIDCQNSGRGFYFHNNETATSVVNGFTIRNGHSSQCGGIFNSSSSPTITNCSFVNNSSDFNGGGISNYNSSSPSIINCIFNGNSAEINGGAIWNYNHSLPTITNCSFVDNSSNGSVIYNDYYSSSTITNCSFESSAAEQNGGGISNNYQSSPTIINCTFKGNGSKSDGGGVSNYNASSPRIINCTFIGNSSESHGGGISNYKSSPTIENCTFVDNHSDQGGGVGSYNLSSPTITNCILWNNIATAGNEIYKSADSTSTISYCDIEGSGGSGASWDSSLGVDDGGNIDDDPLFRDQGNGELGLQSNSPCIDTASNISTIYSDIRGSLRPVDVNGEGNDPLHNNFDMGAFEYSLFYSGEEDVTIKAFEEVGIKCIRIAVNYECDIQWSTQDPFPNNDLRITQPANYTVRRFLVGEDGRSILLDTITNVPLQEPQGGYSYPFIFAENHVGTWFIKIEMAHDPNQFEISEDTIIIESGVKTWIIGKEVSPPEGADPTYGDGPEMEEGYEDHYYWYANKLYAIRPTINDTAIITWFDSNGYCISVEGTNVWPTDPQIHVAGSAPVDLLPDGSNYKDVQLKYNTNDSLINVDQFTFTANEDGYSVLIYWEDNVEEGPLLFEVVKTVLWNDSDHFSEEDWDIGDEITSQDHDLVCDNGYVFNEFSTYAVNTQIEEPYDGYDRASRTGPIVPVNLDYDSETTDDDLLVVWYEKGITGACWPYKPVRYNPQWPVPAGPEDKIIIAKMDGTGNQFVGYSSVRIYNQPDPEQPGFNPNEEHALIVGDTVFALRDDLNSIRNLSQPYVLVKYQEVDDNNEWKFRVFEVIAEEPPYPNKIFKYTGFAGTEIQAPRPLNSFPVCMESSGLPGGPWWEDYEGTLYAKKDGTGILRFYYPLQEGFFYDLDGDGEPDEVVGTCIPWLDRRPGGTEGVPVDVIYDISWPAPIELHVGETLIEAKRDLPDIAPQCSVEIIYDQSGDSVRLMEVLSEREVDLVALPAEIKTKEIGSNTVIFPDLPPHLTKDNRVSYDYSNRKLKFKGVFDDSGVGENPLLLLNIMSERDRDFIANLDEDLDAPEFQAAVAALFTVTREHLSGETEIVGTDIFKVLTAAAPTGGSGYVTLAFNNNEEFCKGNPVGLSVIKVDCADLYAGELKLLEPENVFDERMTFVHSGDFAGEPDNLIFEWKYSTSIDEPDPPDVNPDIWLSLIAKENGEGINDVTIGGSGIQTIQDKWITCCYGGYQRCGEPAVWSDWTDPMLYENWVKRVMRKINPFEQRCDDFHEPGGEVATYVSMIEQAGRRYEGDVALNDDPDYLNSLGLIEFYETLLKRAKQLSIDGTPSVDDEVANNAILLATSRIGDLYMLLGNEAYADASDPTIGYTTESDAGTAAPSIFCFQNQMASLLQEELELLRGRDDSRNPDIDISPFYNRAIWNFTSGNGELAYTMNYAVDTEEEAMTMYPQGHGDAWGHYLTGIKKYYALLRHEKFTWLPRTEQVLVAGTPVEVDYLDERKFAAAAAAKARTGAEIVNLTYRDKYVDDPSGQWQGYKDDDDARAWGLSEWATRAGQGAYFDWVVGNALLPDEDTNPEHTGIQKIDRRTVVELSEVASRFSEIQSELDKADMGLNPLGIAKDAIPFDISPPEVDAGKTHFEQIYERAVQSLNNAIVVFDHANKHSQMLRRQQDALENFQNNVEDREADFNNRLIEIFGYPYEDDIGLGCIYPSGYDGPDILHCSYVDPSVLMGIQPPPVIEFSVTVTDFLDVNASGGLVEQTREIPFHVSAKGFGFIKPPEWTGSRRAPGEIQMARSDLIQTKARFERALVEYNNLLAQIEGEAELLQAQYNMNAGQISIMYGVQGKQQSLNNAIFSARKRQLTYRTIGRMATITANAIAEGFPHSMGIIVGLANGTIADWTSAIRSAVMMAGTVVNETMSQMADAQSLNELAAQQAKEMVQSQSSIELTALQSNFAIEQKLKQIAQLIRSEASLRLELFTLQENIQQASGRYLSTLTRGERLLQDRTRYRKQVADDILEYRHKDMAFRIFRNDALQKYRAQFDLGARYVYLAAKAYDYDTCLLDSSTQAGEQFMTNIVRQRTIGEINGGIPMTGSGLAEPMAEMAQNFTVLKSQMGFNNPQLEENRFSLRRELFRTKSGLASNDQWKEALMRNRIANLWDIPEFRRYCNPFAPEVVTGPTPAMVIPFTTNITYNLNFFGWPLGGGDSYYDSSRFATKVRGVGVWFENYDNANLTDTPRVYLVPVGEDIIRAPYGDSFDTRTFKVVDQLLPVPFAIHSTDLEGNRGWIPINDTLSDSFFNIRRHSRFRAYHDSGAGWDAEIVRDSRLIGRTVWNSEWLLIIPGASLSSEPDEALDTFIETVTDIKFLFETYSYEGGMGVSAEEDEPEAEDGTATE